MNPVAHTIPGWGAVSSRILIAALLLILAGSGTVFAGSGKSTAEGAYEQARQSYYSLIRSNDKKALRQNWMETIQKFQTVLEHFPESFHAYKAAYTIARLYQDLSIQSGNPDDLNQAVKYFHWVAERFSHDRLTDDALVRLGRIHLDRKDYTAASNYFTQVVEKYPNGDQARAAKKELLTLSRMSVKTGPQPPAPKTVRLFDLNYENGNDVAQVSLRSSGPVKFTQERLENPDRIHLVFDKAQWDDQLPNLVTLKTGILTHVEPRRTRDGKSELMVEMTGAGAVSVDLNNSGPRMVLKFKSVPRENSRQAEAAPEVPPALTEKKNGIPVVILDPGHGGKDDGAHGAEGVLEKEINLRIALRVRRILEKRYGYKVALTRTDDTFIELKDRGDFANKANADLFVSIHANAAPRKSAQGIETYYLGTGSSDRALETAARENGELVESVEDDDVQQILASLISTTKMNDSARLAAEIQKRLVGVMSRKYSQVQDLGVKEGPFYVLHRTNMPSILIEVGFVTNRQEEQRLKHATYQYWLAESIAQGIHLYLKEKGPSI